MALTLIREMRDHLRQFRLVVLYNKRTVGTPSDDEYACIIRSKSEQPERMTSLFKMCRQFNAHLGVVVTLRVRELVRA